jgi:molecular chaperone HscB
VFSLNAFLIFGIKAEFNLNLAKLDELYADLQRQAHPDINSCAQLDSAQINFAYKTLSDPVLRAFHLLELHGVKVECFKDVQDLLAYICQESEKLESLQSRASIKAFIDEKELHSKEVIKDLAALDLPDELDVFARRAIELKYVSNLVKNAKLRL